MTPVRYYRHHPEAADVTVNPETGVLTVASEPAPEAFCPHSNVPVSQCVACNANERLVEAAEALDRAYAGHGFHGLLASLEAVIELLQEGRTA